MMHFEQCLDNYEHNTVIITESLKPAETFFDELQL